jgi:hypothetical protein
MDAKGNRSPSTVTKLAANVTEVITVTAQAAQQAPAEALTMPAGVMPPAGAAGGTGSKTAAIVKTSDPSTPNVGKLGQHQIMIPTNSI